MTRRNLSVLLAGLAIGLLCYTRAEQNPYSRYASEAYRLIDDEALETPPDEELFAGAVRGMVSVLRRRGDDHTDYLEPTAAESFRADMDQQFGGVGIRVAMQGEPPRVTIFEPPPPGTPAFGSPIRVRDVIVSVDGVATAEQTLAQVVGLMRGPVGEQVTLTVRHENGEEETFGLTRQVIRVPSVIGDRRTPDGGWRFRLEHDPSLALVRVTTFGQRTAGELEETLARLTDEGVRAVVLDLRGNPGGEVRAAIDVCDLLLPADMIICTTRGRDGEVVAEYRTTTPGRFRDLPIGVLLDGDSASASEIVAAALQDHGRATLVGGRSFGKGTVQHLLPLEAGRSSLKLTVASYWRPNGVNIHRMRDTPDSATWGVLPDREGLVSLTEEQRKAWSAWRRQRDLLTIEGVAPPTPAPAPLLEADATLARAVELLGPPTAASAAE